MLATRTALVNAGTVEYRLEPGKRPPSSCSREDTCMPGSPSARTRCAPRAPRSSSSRDPGTAEPGSAPSVPGSSQSWPASCATAWESPPVEAVVGISAGGRTAVEMAAHDPRRVRRLILQSAAPALGPWPESRAQRLVAPSSSGPGPDRSPGPPRGSCSPGEPHLGTRAVVNPLTNLSPEACLNRLTPTEREDVRSLFCQMASGTGFRNDLRDFVVRDPADVRLTLFRRSLPDAGHGLAARPRVRDHHPANRCLRNPQHHGTCSGTAPTARASARRSRHSSAPVD